MLRKIVLPVLAALGICFAIFMIYWGARKPPAPPILFEPPQSPYEHYVAGEGLIESLHENVKIGVAFPEIVWEAYVKVGDKVKKNQPLFKLDIRQPESDLETAVQELKLAKTNLADQTRRFSYYEQLKDKSAVSKQDYTDAYYAKQQAEDSVRVALSNVGTIKTIIERSIIRAPNDGQILQENTRVGESANVNPFDRIPLMVFGKIQTVQIRVNIAEEDAWRVIPNAAGKAFVRGNRSISIPLTFRQIEPLIVPKDLLSGSDFERVDTRVLQIIYEFDKADLPVYIGQLLDVYLEAKPGAIS